MRSHMHKRGLTNGTVAELDLRVRYAETDRMGVVYYANYFVWFEMGRSEYCRQLGFQYLDLEALGYRLVVAEASCKYRSPARYDDVVTVRTALHKLERRLLTFRYHVVRKKSVEMPAETLVQGETTHLCIDAAGKIKTIPEPFLTYLAQSPPHHNSHA
jgi:acyl-CoA thioester hydrolase